MSKFYHFHKNFTFQEVMNLLCYGCKQPQTLSTNQKITRLYRSTLRKIYATNMEGYKTDHADFNRLLQKSSRDFYRMIELPSDSVELKTLIRKYEQWHEDLYDPSMVIDECRAYSSTSARYPIWSNGALSFDPFGYYSKKRLVSEKRPMENFPYYEAYPMVSSQWNYYESFPEDFDDTNYEKLEVDEKNKSAERNKL